MSTHDVTLVFEDGRSVRIPADENDTIYLAALKKRIRLETDCREGACATCKGLCTAGEYRMNDYSDEALSDEEAARREVLTCQMYALTDCVIELPYESDLAMKGEPVTQTGRVSAVEQVSSTVWRLAVELPDDAVIEFLPGQYVHLGVPGSDARRSYSFANAPGAPGPLVFYVKVLESGAMSDYVRDRAAVGDEMPVTGPFGHFYLRAPDRPILMVAGGTGLAPMLSMMDHMVATGATGPKVRLLYGANTADELFGDAQLAAYPDKGLDLTIEVAVVEAGADWRGATGHVTGLLRPELIADGPCDVYLCGPPPMIEAGETWLAENGVDPAWIHAEKFLPS